MIAKQEYRDDLLFMTIENAVRKSGWSAYAIRRGIKAGTIPHKRSGRRIFVYMDMSKWMETG